LEGILAAEQAASVLLGASENSFTKGSLFLPINLDPPLSTFPTANTPAFATSETKKLGCSASTPANSSGLNIPTKIVRLGRTKSSDTYS
jgi:hypothetical protein